MLLACVAYTHQSHRHKLEHDWLVQDHHVDLKMITMQLTLTTGSGPLARGEC